MTTKTKETTHTPESYAIAQAGEQAKSWAFDQIARFRPGGANHRRLRELQDAGEFLDNNAERLCATWNACATLPDPAVVPELVELLAFTFENYSKGSPAFADRCRAILARCGKIHLAV